VLAPLSLSNVDDEVPGLIITTVDDDTETSEGGEQVILRVALRVRPTQPLWVQASIDGDEADLGSFYYTDQDAAVGEVDAGSNPDLTFRRAASLYFVPSSWDEPQELTVVG
jgi:hypothetical protein